jgi:hypothetical protein
MTTNILMFPDLRPPPDEEQWREYFRRARSERGGNASRDIELARRLAAVCRKLNDRPLPREEVHWPPDLPANPALMAEIRRVVAAQLEANSSCASFLLVAAVLNVVLTLTGADIEEDGPLDRPPG